MAALVGRVYNNTLLAITLIVRYHKFHVTFRGKVALIANVAYIL